MSRTSTPSGERGDPTRPVTDQSSRGAPSRAPASPTRSFTRRPFGGTRLTERMPIPTVGWSAHFEDPEGNKVGVFQSDPTVPMPEGDLPD
jgi:hypothetical protein